MEIKSVLLKIKDRAPAAFLAAVTGSAVFQLGEDYGEYQVYHQLDTRRISSMTDLFIQKACPQLSQTELALGIIKPEEDIKAPAFSFVVGEILEDEAISTSSQNTHNDALFVFINSPGGDVNQTEAFLEQAKSTSDKIVTIVDGKAASAAFTIAVSGSPGYRIMTAESHLMVHQSYVMVDGKAHQQSDLPYWSYKRLGMKSTAIQTKVIMEDASPSLSEECINALLRQKTDTSIPAIDALKLGLIDAIIGPKITEATAQGTPAMVRKGDPREIVLAPGPKP